MMPCKSTLVLCNDGNVTMPCKTALLRHYKAVRRSWWSRLSGSLAVLQDLVKIEMPFYWISSLTRIFSMPSKSEVKNVSSNFLTATDMFNDCAEYFQSWKRVKLKMFHRLGNKDIKFMKISTIILKGMMTLALKVKAMFTVTLGIGTLIIESVILIYRQFSCGCRISLNYSLTLSKEVRLIDEVIVVLFLNKFTRLTSHYLPLIGFEPWTSCSVSYKFNNFNWCSNHLSYQEQVELIILLENELGTFARIKPVL